MSLNHIPRPLTHDEKKAAEAAFAGRPFDPSWSKGARTVYDGILSARGLPAPAPQPATDETTGRDPSNQPVPTSSPEPTASPEESGAAPGLQPDSPRPLPVSREDAIRVGALIDVTSIAHRLGLPLPVGISRPLWEIGITGSRNVSEEHYENRVRDVLMAFRLRLAGSRLASPLIEFPALLSFPPDPVPQACSLCAVVHGDSPSSLSVTFLLPGEVSTGFLPFTNN